MNLETVEEYDARLKYVGEMLDRFAALKGRVSHSYLDLAKAELENLGRVYRAGKAIAEFFREEGVTARDVVDLPPEIGRSLAKYAMVTEHMEPVIETNVRGVFKDRPVPNMGDFRENPEKFYGGLIETAEAIVKRRDEEVDRR